MPAGKLSGVVKILRSLWLGVVGFLLGIAILLGIALVLGFFVGIPVVCGILFGDRGDWWLLAMALTPFVVGFALWRYGVKRGWIRFREPHEYPYKN